MKKVLVFCHVPHEGLGTIEPFLKHLAVDIEYCDLFRSDTVPSDPSTYDFIISMGGPINVDETEKFPFLKSERTFISDAIHAGKPVLGICLGAQLIARALGAKVYPGTQKEIGWYPIRLSEAGKTDSAFANIGASEPVVFQWHGDTFDLPKGAALLASSAVYSNQAFKFKTSVYAFQFHIEITREMIYDWLEKGGEELRSSDSLISKEKIAREIDQYTTQLQEMAERVYGGLFSQLVTADSRF